MIQDDVFLTREGNQWFARNRNVLGRKGRFDFPLYILQQYFSQVHNDVTKFIEFGCSNGWRLAILRELFGTEKTYTGIDSSQDAIEDGKKNFAGINLIHSTLTNVPDYVSDYDIGIVNFVLHWVDRNTLAKSVSEIDRSIADGGYLLLGDFFPDSAIRRQYHHCPNEEIYTYKQDYSAIFEALGTYKPVYKMVYNHDEPKLGFERTTADNRAVCTLLEKRLNNYYTIWGR